MVRALANSHPPPPHTTTFISDLAYANGCEGKTGGCETWNEYQLLMEPHCSETACACCIGNHEEQDVPDGIYAGSARKRFAGMPTTSPVDDLYYFS